MGNERTASNFFLCLLVLSMILVALMFLPYLGAFVLAIVFAIIFGPLYRKLKGAMPHYESFAAFISVVLAIIVILIPLVFFGVVIFREAQGVYATLAVGGGLPALTTIRNWISGVFPSLNINFGQYLELFLNWLIANIGPIFSQILQITITLFLSVFTFYFLLKDGPKIHDAIIRVSPLKHDDTEKILGKLTRMASSVIKGSLVVSVLQGILVGLGFYIFGLQNPVLWGSVAVICALVPMFGVAIVVVPTAIILLVSGSPTVAILFTVWGLLLPALVDNFVRPRLIDHDTDVHPLLVLFSVIGGITVFGPIGLILGPLALSLLLTLSEIYPTIFKEA